MTINGHFLLLVVATGLFVRLWSTNDRQRPPAVWRTPSRSASTMPPPQPVVADQAVEVPAQVVSTESSAESAIEEVWTAGTCPIPLPTGIVAGVYRVVDDSGRVARLELAETVADVGELADSADILLLIVDSRRWYFIRIQAPVARNAIESDVEIGAKIVPPVADAEPVRTASANRKFDFSGYAASETIESVQDFHPESPAMPVTE